MDRRDLDAEGEEIEEEIGNEVARRDDGNGDDDRGRNARPRCGLGLRARALGRRRILVGHGGQGQKSDRARGELGGEESFHR